MLKVEQVVTYQIEDLKGLSAPSAIGLAMLEAYNDEDCLFIIADVAKSCIVRYEEEYNTMRLFDDDYCAEIIFSVIESGLEIIFCRSDEVFFQTIVPVENLVRDLKLEVC